MKLLSRVRLFVTPWTVAYQAPPSVGFSRQEYWSGLPFPSPGGSSRPRDRTQVSLTVGRRFTIWATREVQGLLSRKAVYILGFILPHVMHTNDQVIQLYHSYKMLWKIPNELSGQPIPFNWLPSFNSRMGSLNSLVILKTVKVQFQTSPVWHFYVLLLSCPPYISHLLCISII